MPKLNKHSIPMAVIAFLVICLAIFLRNMWRIFDTTEHMDFITGCMRGGIYIGLFSAWSFSLRYRIIQTQARHYLTAISDLMVFWIAARSLKFLFFNDTTMGRYLWYLYYFPMLFIPLLALFIALSLGKPEKFRLPNWGNILFVVSSLFLILVLTNDYHQLVFGFPSGLMHYESREYTYRFVYYLIMGWTSICSVSAFVFIVVKCRVPYTKRKVFLPGIPLVLLVTYTVLYLTALDFIQVIAGDMTVVICILTALTVEAFIQCGLIQSNTHYSELFECTSIRVKIADEDYNILLSSINTKPLSKEVMRRTETAPVMLDNRLRLCGAPIKMGHVMWSEDISEMTEVLAELADNSEYLTTRRAVLHKEVETRKEEQRLTEKNRLYNRLMNDNQEEFALFSDLLCQLEATNDAKEEKELTAKISVVCTHIKRRSNLLFLSEKGEEINTSELQFALEEWLSNLRQCGVKCNLFFSVNSTLTFSETVALYDAFQQIILYTLDTLFSLLVTVAEKDGGLFLLLNMSCGCDLSKVSYPDVSISDEDNGEWIITISIPKGGTSV